ncbi:type VI secretion system baseplate subunit TssK [Pseudoxanthomonas sp.]|uniref:type VI secretion system baseplate subunit TssK n=1 Tax=Pseudoxanthomonas sp. TaxID=1871049 RepID=UPI0026168ABF|nr:type VI secretion system baseplate subunit TssK [Pseudoxanthomonas sp.]WDS37805.1 MAG: type VI secretion system baseplate subunit TssK [Pseudoxanthomonas sp.]
MTQNNKVIWSEGLFLRPQHLQQQERYLERHIELRTGRLHAHGWGLDELELDEDLLAIGKLGLRRAQGVFPDGTAFSMPGDDPLPVPLEVDASWRDQTVYLTLPLRVPSQPEIGRAESPKDQLFRYRVREAEVADATGSVGGSVLMEVGGIACRLQVQSQPLEGLACIPLARIVESRADRRVLLDEGYLPTVTRSHAAVRLGGFLTELLGLLHQRAEALAARVALSDRGGAAEIADFLLLQVINRWQPVVAHWSASGGPHPEVLFRELSGLAGELSTFTAPGKRPSALPGYRHEALTESFEPLIAALRGALSTVLEQTALAIPVQARKYGVWVAMLPDPGLVDTAALVLAVRADFPGEELRRRLPAQAKVGPVEKIRDLVNLQLPGIPLLPMPVAPRQIPYHAGAVYFEFDRTAPLWRELKTSGGLAMHMGSEVPGLDMQLWAIRN